ncbi:unnamed protein product [Linum tenue]|uniref:Uncharacterized protein n=1 Tax=Linum tenue TaxID=586396 RepID=A0AAV0I5V0_9ROSI|nr:unnamed protein product [Linum tenue]
MKWRRKSLFSSSMQWEDAYDERNHRVRHGRHFWLHLQVIWQKIIILNFPRGLIRKTDWFLGVFHNQEREFVLKFSAIKIYNEAGRDLLGSDPSPLRLLDDPKVNSQLSSWLLLQFRRSWWPRHRVRGR